MFHTIPSRPVPALVIPTVMACIGGVPRSLFGATAGAASKPPSARDAGAFNHETSAAETIPCGTDGSVRRYQRRQHSQSRASDLHKLAIKVKIDRSGAALWSAPWRNERPFRERAMKLGI